MSVRVRKRYFLRGRNHGNSEPIATPASSTARNHPHAGIVNWKTRKCSVAGATFEKTKVGFCTDLLVRAGATVMFSEVTEVRDGIDQLTSRASCPGTGA